MGDTGSLTIGGIIAVISIAVKRMAVAFDMRNFLDRKFISNYSNSISSILSRNLVLAKGF